MRPAAAGAATRATRATCALASCGRSLRDYLTATRIGIAGLLLAATARSDAGGEKGKRH